MRLATERVGHGRRVVLVHGFTQTGRSWRALAARLAADHEVVTVDAPGHGDSAAIDADLPRSGELLVEAGGRATYVGYSMGGRMCLHAALASPDVEGLVLVGATAGIDDEDERAARRAADEALADRIEAIGVDAFLDEWLAQPLFAGLDDGRADRPARVSNTTAGLASSLRSAGTGTQPPSWERLHTIDVPVLVVAGEHDPKFRAAGERLAVCVGANARLAVVEGAGHSVPAEQPDAFGELLVGWLTSHGL